VTMKWRFGLRVADVFYDSNAVEPFAAAAVGSGIFETHVSNHFTGVGPHLGSSSPAIANAGAWHSSHSRRRQLAGAHAAKLQGSHHRPGCCRPADFRRDAPLQPQTVPMITVFAGFRWQPHTCARVHVDCGYQYEYCGTSAG